MGWTIRPITDGAEPSREDTKLLLDGYELILATSSSKTAAESTAKACGGFIRNYGVMVDTVDPKTGIIKKWRRVEGVSVWKNI